MLGRYLEMLQSNQASILDLIIQRTVLRAPESMNIAKWKAIRGIEIGAICRIHTDRVVQGESTLDQDLKH